jgi:catechol-2,3-dioxygenase
VHATYQSCHSYIRRPDVPAAVLTPFYQKVLGLPVIRPVGEMVTFWAGEDLCFEIKCDSAGRGEHNDPDQAQTLPIMRSHDLAATERRLARHGVTPTHRSSSPAGHRIWVEGPDGHLFGFEERNVGSELAADREALRRWRAGETRLPGVGELPPDLHYMSRILLHVHDVTAVSEFYNSGFGLDRVVQEGGSMLHSLGDTVLLEIAPGGKPRPVPADRTEVANIVMTRVRDLDAFMGDMARVGAPQSGDTIEFFTGSRAAYFADPEGNLLGVQQRTLWGSYPEDLEAERRWHARESAPSA